MWHREPFSLVNGNGSTSFLPFCTQTGDVSEVMVQDSILQSQTVLSRAVLAVMHKVIWSY